VGRLLREEFFEVDAGRAGLKPAPTFGFGYLFAQRLRHEAEEWMKRSEFCAAVFVLVVLLIASVIYSQCAHAASVEDVALLKSADRQKILVEGAKKEGKLTFYTTLIVEQVVRPMKDAFEKEYPFIQMEYFRGNSDRIAQKLFAEYQAKRYAVDVIDGSSTTTMVRRAGLLQKFGGDSFSVRAIR